MVLNINKWLTVDNLNTNRKQEEGKKCDFFSVLTLTLPGLQKYGNNVIKSELYLGILNIDIQYHFLRRRW